MDEVMVVLAGEITKEFEGGLYQTIDGIVIAHDIKIASRDAVIDVFDVIAYYDHAIDFVTQAQWWFDMYLKVKAMKGITNVTLSIGSDQVEDD